MGTLPEDTCKQLVPEGPKNNPAFQTQKSWTKSLGFIQCTSKVLKDIVHFLLNAEPGHNLSLLAVSLFFKHFTSSIASHSWLFWLTTSLPRQNDFSITAKYQRFSNGRFETRIWKQMLPCWKGKQKNVTCFCGGFLCHGFYNQPMMERLIALYRLFLVPVCILLTPESTLLSFSLMFPHLSCPAGCLQDLQRLHVSTPSPQVHIKS